MKSVIIPFTVFSGSGGLKSQGTALRSIATRHFSRVKVGVERTTVGQSTKQKKSEDVDCLGKNTSFSNY